jgi:ankyrin repeat protein
MLAAWKGKLEVCRYLTQIGADINIRNANKYTALCLSAYSGNVDIIKLLLDKRKFYYLVEFPAALS